MSVSTTIAVSSDTVVRKDDDGTNKTGCGNSKHLYVGKFSGLFYYSFLKFSIDWDGLNIKKLISATLNIYTDEYNTFGLSGEPGIMPPPGSKDTPKVKAYRLTEAFTEGNNADGVFNSSDYTFPSHTTDGGVVKSMLPKGAALLNQINVLDIIKAIAPGSVTGGGKHANHGIGLYGTTDATENWSGWAQEHGNGAERPSLTLVYDLGPTIPNAPASMTPSGTIATLDAFEGNFSDPRGTDTLQSTSIQVYDAGHSSTASTSDRIISTAHGLIVGDAVVFTAVQAGIDAFRRYFVISGSFDADHFKVSETAGGASIDITANGAVTWSKLLVNATRVATQSDRVAAHFFVPTDGLFAPKSATTYRWRARNTDQEAQVSPWSALVSFILSNNPPNAPTLSPLTGSSYESLNLVQFKGGTFTDPDAGDYLAFHQVQLSALPPGDIGWDEGDAILWDSGKVPDPIGAVSWSELYGGRALDAGTYYWRARQYDQRDGVSNWTYATIVLSASFDPDPGTYDNVQIDPQAPWRIIIRDLLKADGSPTAGRGPGQVVAVLEEAKNPGASLVYNSPGEIHFTLLKDDEQISVIEPKQTHYALEFYSGDGWQEKYAGVIWDADATDTDVVFKGIDYLALYDTVIDERYDPLKPNKSYKNNGSFYENVTIRNIVLDQLAFAKKQTDSWVGFISIGSIASMGEKATVYSTMQPALSFISGLIDSHRQGTGKRTRMKVVKTTTGGYQLQIVDDPGVIRSDLALYYGELVQGYRVIFFGDAFANVQHVIGRNRDGVKVVYQTIKNKPFQPATSLYGRIATVAVMDGVQDQADLNRRGLQAAIQSAKLGRNIAIGIRTQFLQALQGWDLCDVFPVKILDGAVDTDAFGSGFWAAYAVAWEGTDIGEQSVVITLMPREDSAAPDPSLIPSVPVSTQPEWQIGWLPPDPLKASSKNWVDQSTGKVYKRVDSTDTVVAVTGTP